MVNDSKWLPVVFGIPVVILLLFMTAAGTLGIPEGEIIYRKFISQWPVVDVLFPLTAIWAGICAAVGVRRLWAGFKEGLPKGALREHNASPVAFVTQYVIPTITDILKHSNFKECVVNRIRYLAHLNMLWGFVLLFMTTASVFIGVYIFGKETPYPLSNPIKWIGNIGAVIVILGSLVAIGNRLSQGEDAGKATYFDWLFLLVVLATGISGLLTEILRLADVPGVAYPTYFVHLVFVWFLFAYLPFSKFAHLLYRTTAMVFARYTGREMKKGSAVSHVGPQAVQQAPGEDKGDQGTSPDDKENA
jgi:quinone-modifying oxidoreductase subunit QmoC